MAVIGLSLSSDHMQRSIKNKFIECICRLGEMVTDWF